MALPRSLSVVILAVLVSQSASAALVRVEFSGLVERFEGEVYDNDSGERTPIDPAEAEALLGGSLHVGTPYSAFFVYDDATLPYVSGAYSLSGASFAAHAEVGAFAGDAYRGWLGIADSELSPSNVHFIGYMGDPFGSDVFVMSSLGLVANGDGPGSPLDGSSLQGIPWDVESFPNLHVELGFWAGDLRVRAYGSVTRLVPEPAAMILVALALCVVLAYR